MDTSSAKTTAPRGRPRLRAEKFETLMRDHGWARGFSRHDRTNAVHMFHAIGQLSTIRALPGCVAMGQANGDPTESRGHLRRTILTELGRVQDAKHAGRQLALQAVRAEQPTTREAVGANPCLSPRQAPRRNRAPTRQGLGLTLLQYLANHSAMELEEIRRALARMLGAWVDRIVDEEN